jgi:thiol-disulfide isomerase/thioredoxin
MFSAIRQSFGSDFQFSMYQGDIGLASQNAQFQDLFPSDKPVVLNFWAGLCPPCRAEMPGFQRVYDEYQDRIILLGLDVGPYMNLGSNGDARRLLSELNITYPTGYSHSRDPVAQFGVTAMPTTIFLTPDGKVFRTAIGFIDEGRLERSIQNLLTASETS